ncbi:MAG: nucleoside 2-deoxyribosyltransferase [Candidatus Heimdallarchaeota archaeon]
MNDKAIYVAGPLFSLAEKQFLMKFVADIAKKLNLNPIKHFFLPHRDAGDLGITNGRDKIFNNDLRFLKEADIVIAILDGSDVDSGTAVELGIAFAQKKRIYAYLTDIRAYGMSNELQKLNNMIWGVCNSGNNIYRDIDDLCLKIESDIKLNNT